MEATTRVVMALERLKGVFLEIPGRNCPWPMPP
jgi:hypothetical protein